jgi:hypothetical protein
MQKILFVLTVILTFTSCDTNSIKQMQTIDFSDIAPQQLRDSSVTLHAKASSGLPVLFLSLDTEIAVIDGDIAVFKQAGTVNIVAIQSGNDQFFEAINVTRQLIIRDWDPNKKTQEISFELPAEWKISRDGQLLKPNATASSGLPVSYILSSEEYGRFVNPKTVYFYHAGEGGTSPSEIYNITVSIIASQNGNDEYNPADNVKQTIQVIGDVFH